jgi:hypothetical protein
VTSDSQAASPDSTRSTVGKRAVVERNTLPVSVLRHRAYVPAHQHQADVPLVPVLLPHQPAHQRRHLQDGGVSDHATITVDDENQQLRGQWEDIIEHILRLRPFMIEVGLDYFCYGNAFVSIHYPFEKYLICGSCKLRGEDQEGELQVPEPQVLP